MFVKSIYNKFKQLPTKLLADFFNHEFEPLHSAASHGNLDEIRRLLVHRDVDEISKAFIKSFLGTQGCTPLYIAAQQGQLEAVKLLLDNGANIRRKCYRGATPLHAAISRGHIKVIQYLLEQGAPVDTTDQDGNTPLHCAAGWQDEASLELLINCKADVLARNKLGATALHLAVNKGFVYNALEVKVDSVLKAVQSHWMSNLLYLTFKMLWLGLGLLSQLHDWLTENPNRLSYQRSIQSKVLGCCRLLLKHGSDINDQQQDLRTPLHIAAGFQTVYLDVVEFLVDSNAELNIIDEDGQTPLHEAAQCGFTAAVAFLISRGAIVDFKDKNNWTPLHFACKYGHFRTAVTLLNAGADVDAQTMKGSTPLHLASDLKYVDHVKLLPTLLDYGANPNMTNVYSETSLHVALRGQLNGVPNGHDLLLDVVGLLITKISDINQKTKWGDTHLHVAAAAGSPELVEALLRRGADLHARDNNGRTPLHEAAQAAAQKVVCLLLDNGADWTAKDKDERTPDQWLSSLSWWRPIKRKLDRDAARINAKVEAAASGLLSVDAGQNGWHDAQQ